MYHIVFRRLRAKRTRLPNACFGRVSWADGEKRRVLRPPRVVRLCRFVHGLLWLQAVASRRFRAERGRLQNTSLGRVLWAGSENCVSRTATASYGGAAWHVGSPNRIPLSPADFERKEGARGMSISERLHGQMGRTARPTPAMRRTAVLLRTETCLKSCYWIPLRLRARDELSKSVSPGVLMGGRPEMRVSSRASGVPRRRSGCALC